MSTHKNHSDDTDRPDDRHRTGDRHRTDTDRNRPDDRYWADSGRHRPDDDRHRTDDVRDRTASGRQRTRAAAPSFPDACAVGSHLVIDKTEWVPGRHPERHVGYDGQRGYAESYLRCIQCGAERQSEQGFPPECDGDA